MSSPAIIYFCKNGHLVESIPHGYVAYHENPIYCQYCGEENIASVIECWDEAYGVSVVPIKPVKYEQRTVSIAVYDVSKLFGHEKGAVFVTNK